MPALQILASRVQPSITQIGGLGWWGLPPSILWKLHKLLYELKNFPHYFDAYQPPHSTSLFCTYDHLFKIYMDFPIIVIADYWWGITDFRNHKTLTQELQRYFQLLYTSWSENFTLPNSSLHLFTETNIFRVKWKNIASSYTTQCKKARMYLSCSGTVKLRGSLDRHRYFVINVQILDTFSHLYPNTLQFRYRSPQPEH